MPFIGEPRSSRWHSTSSGAAVVVAQRSAEAFAAVDDAFGAADFAAGVDQAVAESLMIPFGVIVRRELGQRSDRSPKKIIRSRHSSRSDRMKRSR